MTNTTGRLAQAGTGQLNERSPDYHHWPPGLLHAWVLREFRPSLAVLLAAVALQVIHGIDRYCIAADVVVVVHEDLLGVVCREVKSLFRLHQLFSCLRRESPLYNPNDTPVIPLHLVFRRVAIFFYFTRNCRHSRISERFS